MRRTRATPAPHTRRTRATHAPHTRRSDATHMPHTRRTHVRVRVAYACRTGACSCADGHARARARAQVSSLQLLSNAAIAVVWTAINALVLARATTPGFYDLSALHEPSVVAGVLYTGLISTALTVLLQTRALSMLPATDSSVIVATEPLWAAGFATILLGEVLDTNAQIGGAMILAGCLSNVLLPEDIGMPATEPSPEQEA